MQKLVKKNIVMTLKKGYKVYFTNAEFEYQKAKRKVEINEYMIAFKEWEEI